MLDTTHHIHHLGIAETILALMTVRGGQAYQACEESFLPVSDWIPETPGWRTVYLTADARRLTLVGDLTDLKIVEPADA